MQATNAGTQPRRLLRSTAAVIAGFFTVAFLSLATDQLLHVLDVYPPWGQPMFEPGLNALALSYRIVYAILGGYVTAKLAPHSPVRHAVILGVIGTVAATAGALATIPMNLGPAWYPILLALTGIPCSWLGSMLYQRTHSVQAPARMTAS